MITYRFFPAAGRRGSDGTPLYRGLLGLYWSSSVYSTTHGMHMAIREGFTFLHSAIRVEATSVRCVARKGL